MWISDDKDAFIVMMMIPVMMMMMMTVIAIIGTDHCFFILIQECKVFENNFALFDILYIF